jgi:hypothetical protein
MYLAQGTAMCGEKRGAIELFKLYYALPFSSQNVSNAVPNKLMLADCLQGEKRRGGHLGYLQRHALVLTEERPSGLGGAFLLFILGSNLGGEGPVRGLRGGRKKGVV